VRRRLFNLAVPLSLTVFVAIAILWAISRYYSQIVTVRFPSHGPVTRMIHLNSAASGIEFEWNSSTNLRASENLAGSIEFRTDRLGGLYYFNFLPRGRFGFRADTNTYDLYDAHDTAAVNSADPWDPGAGPLEPPSRRIHQLNLRVPYWSLMIFMLVCPAWSWRRRWHDRRMQGRCADCGYDLRATPDRCPECGKVVTAMSEPAA
jgi:hypothetical protein